MAVSNDYNFSLADVCPQILVSAENFAGSNYAMNLSKSLGTLDFITDSRNMGGIKAEYSQNGSKIIRAKVTYKQRTLPCEVQDGEDAKDVSICDTAVEDNTLSVDVQVDDAIATTPRKFTATNMVQICQDMDSFVREYINSDLRAAREKLNNKILSKIAVNIGVNKRQNGTDTAADTYTDLTVTGTANGQKIPLAGNFNEALMDYQNNLFGGIPAFIGQGNLQTFYNLMGYACCNSSVISYEEALAKANSAFYLDQSATAVLGPNDGSGDTRGLMLAYGASHLLWFNKNAGINIQSPTIAHIVIPDPVYPNLSWNMNFKWDECDEVWVYNFSTAFDVFNVFQSDSFKQNDPTPACDDELFGVTGIWGYNFQHATS